MKPVIIHTDTEDTYRLFVGLAKKIGLSAEAVTEQWLEKIEDEFLAQAIEKGENTPLVERETIMKTLRKK